MAKQKGILPIEGTIGNLTFFKSADGYLVRSKGGVSADKIATDPAFQRTRENNAEFGRAGKGARLLRTTFRNSIARAKDSRFSSRLTAAMLRVVQADTINDRGLRNVIDGEATLLEGFECNLQAKLSATLFAPYTASVDRTTGIATVDLPAFVPATGIAAPPAATHYGIFMSAAAVNFEGETYEGDTALSGMLPWNNTPAAVLSLEVTLPAGSTHPLFLLLGIEFMQEVNGKMYALNNGAFNACSFIKVDGGT